VIGVFTRHVSAMMLWQ